MSTTASDLKLTVNRYIKAPRERVFAAWTTPEDIMRWFGPGGCRVLSAKVDARPGGGFHFHMKTETMGELDVKGVYREITKPSKLVFTWAWSGNAEMSGDETLVTVDIAEAQGGCNVSITHEGFQDAETRDNHDQGWSGTLDKLERGIEACEQNRMPGHISWNELLVPDVDAAVAFYSKVFGWECVPMQGGMPYTILKKDGIDVGGLMKTPVEGMPAHWLAYVTVENADASYASAISLGGKSCVPPFDIPNVGRIAVVLDPQGAKFGFFQPGK